uniref:Uncharacterized protein n=1 Tax=Tanacetum cinerariifolium TaxID=118510 RepID=A0A6L2N017_TANCI|nr:hypothetical protein [Tanacetum cinerariifolium]
MLPVANLYNIRTILFFRSNCHLQTLSLSNLQPSIATPYDWGYSKKKGKEQDHDHHHHNEIEYETKAHENSKVSFSIPAGGIYGELGFGFQQLDMGKKILPKELSRRVAFLLGGDYANIYWEDIINKLKKKQREKVVPYTRFLSSLIMHKMKDEYGDGDVILYPLFQPT